MKIYWFCFNPYFIARAWEILFFIGRERLYSGYKFLTKYFMIISSFKWKWNPWNFEYRMREKY